MPFYPKIERICPYLDRLDAVMDGDFCRMCKRTVHDLTDMNDGERSAFMAACGGDACISYKMKLSPALVAAALAAGAAVMLPAPAMAQQRSKGSPAQVRVPKPPRYVRLPKPVRYVPIPMVTAGLPAPIDPPPLPLPPPEAIKPD